MAGEFRPAGEEREVRLVGGPSIDGAPVAYIVVLAAVVTALSFVPFSVVFQTGGSFPLSQAIYALVGVILGPWAGALAAGIGRLIAIFISPHTAGAGPISALFAVVWAAAGGILVQKGRGWVLALALFVAAYLGFVGRALTMDVTLPLALQSTAVNVLGLLLWVLPTRALARQWIADANLGRVTAGLLLGCLMVNANAHTFSSSVLYNFYQSWPADVWRILIPIVPTEQFFRTLVGAIIGVGVIAGLRAIRIRKPDHAGY